MNRRQLLKTGIGAVEIALTHSTLARAMDVCGLTPEQTPGPFYPGKDEFLKITDLVNLPGRPRPAEGVQILVSGVVQDTECQPISNAVVELWQAAHSGRYNHERDPNPAPLDPNFAYWGRAITNSSGEYRFLTVIPGEYPAGKNWVRPPHLHFKVARRGYRDLTTQMYFQGNELNKKDDIFKALSPAEQARVAVPVQQKNGKNLCKFKITLESV